MSTTAPLALLAIGTLRTGAYFLAIYGITIVASIWIARDAYRRGQSIAIAIGWGVFGLLVPAVSHLLYLYLRRKHEGSITG